jgi:hypothetical protein
MCRETASLGEGIAARTGATASKRDAGVAARSSPGVVPEVVPEVASDATKLTAYRAVDPINR